MMTLKADAKFKGNYRRVMSHNSEECAKFEEKLTRGSKNDMRNLVNFNVSSGRSEILHFDVLLFSLAYKVSAKKVQKNYLSWHWKKIQTLKKELTLCLKKEMRNLVNFKTSSGKSENLHFDGLIL